MYGTGKPLLRFVVLDSWDHRWTLPLPSNENNRPGNPPPSRPRPLFLPTFGGGSEKEESQPLQPLRGPRRRPSNDDWRGVWAGLARARHAGEGRQHVDAGFSPLGPLALLGRVNLCRLLRRHPSVVVRSRAGAIIPVLLGLTAAVPSLPCPPGGSPRRAFRREGGSGLGPAAGSDGRRRAQRPGMFGLMAHCCSWFQRRQEPVR